MKHLMSLGFFWSVGLVMFPVHAEMIPLDRPLDRSGFERVASENGVDVYLHRSTEHLRFAAEGLIRAAPLRLLAALLDYDQQVGVLGNLAEARILQRNAQSALVYQRLALPVANDRDITMRVQWGERGNIYWLTQRAASNVGPAPRDGIIRISHHVGSWQLTPYDGGRSTFARFDSSIDLGGSLNGWLARSAVRRTLPMLFEALGTLAGS